MLARAWTQLAEIFAAPLTRVMARSFQSEAVFREKNRFFAGNFAICDAA
jgi:hypothetical protein